MQHGKKYRAIAENIEKGKLYTPAEAIAFFVEHKAAAFDESLEVHVRLGINPKKSDEMVRATAILPYGTGRKQKVAVVTLSKEKEARDAGADVVGGAELVDDIKNGKVAPGAAFDVLLATPDVMPKLASVAKVLGPKGLMPSPKSETVTQKIGEAVEMLKKGKKIAFKNDDTANVHQNLGKLSFAPAELTENFEAFLTALEKARPEALKGRYIRSATMTSTMGPSLTLSL
jgi:large subunit ribosomal protein L1